LTARLVNQSLNASKLAVIVLKVRSNRSSVSSQCSSRRMRRRSSYERPAHGSARAPPALAQLLSPESGRGGCTCNLTRFPPVLVPTGTAVIPANLDLGLAAPKRDPLALLDHTPIFIRPHGSGSDGTYTGFTVL